MNRLVAPCEPLATERHAPPVRRSPIVRKHETLAGAIAVLADESAIRASA